jgi:hypothetical protein
MVMIINLGNIFRQTRPGAVIATKPHVAAG